MRCTHEYVYSYPVDADEMCRHIINGLCDGNQSFVNFIEVYWCDFKGSLSIQLLFAVLAFFVIFKYISITVEEYIADAIAGISSFIGLSDSLAAVTLLAFSNGAADLMTVLIASESEGGISYNIGSLYGGGLFVCSAVVGLCILQTNNRLKLNRVIVYRIVVFYIISTFITIGFALYKYITWWGSCMLLGFYFLIVIIEALDSHFKNKSAIDLNEVSIKPGSYINAINKDNSEMTAEYSVDKFPSEIHTGLIRLHERVVDPSANKVEFSSDPKKNTVEGHQSFNMKNTAEQHSHLQEPKNMTQELRVKRNFIKEWRRIPAERKEGYGYFIYMIETPFIWLLYVTVLPCDREHYSKLRCLIYAITGTLFNVWVVKRSLEWQVYLYALLGGAVLFGVFWATLEPKTPPRWFSLMIVMAMVGGLMWTYILVGVLIDLIECIGLLLNLQRTFLGLTVLAIGSSIPDALTTITLCKQSESILAISGAYAGQLFALTIGFGLSMLKLTLNEGPQNFDLFDMEKLDENSLDILVIFSSIFILVFTFTYSIRNNFKLGKTFAKVLIGCYCLFMAVAVYIGVSNAVKTF